MRKSHFTQCKMAFPFLINSNLNGDYGENKEDGVLGFNMLRGSSFNIQTALVECVALFSRESEKQDLVFEWCPHII